MNDMTAGLIRRGGAYSLRRRIPKDLLAAYQGRKEIVRALGTNDREEAKRLHALAWVELDAQFAAARQQHSAEPDARIREKLRQIAEARARSPSPSPTITDEEFEYTLAKLAVDSEEELREEVEYDKRELPRQKILAVMSVSNVEFLNDSDKALRDVLLDKQWEVERALIRANDAERRLISNPPQPAPKPKSAPLSNSQSDAMLTAVVERWKRERRPTGKTAAAHTAVVRWFTEATGIHSALLVEKKHVQTFKSSLLDGGVSPANIKTKLSRLRTIFNYAVAEGLLKSSPAEGVVAPPSKGPKPVASWPVAELNKLFAGPVHQKGERPVRGRGDAAYWLPLLALFTGARREELGQLRGKDIARLTYAGPNGDAEAWVINIDYGDDGQNQLKTASSQRIIPVHPALLKLGLIELAKVTAPASRLFPELRSARDGKLTEKWGDWFREYRRAQGIADPRLRFHSFRHSFKDWCREAGMVEGVQRQLMGHSASDVADQYGMGFSTHQLVTAIQSFRVPGLVLPPPPKGVS